RLEAVLEEKRSERGLEQSGEDVAIVHEPVELRLRQARRVLAESIAEAEPAGDDGAARTRDDVRADLRHPPFVELGELVEERARDRELEHRVAEELEALVRLRPVGGPARVREDGRDPFRRQRRDQLRERLTGAT